MFIAQKLRKENISEYLLYMWQIEDLLRAFNLDIDLINKQIVEPYPISAEEKKTLYEWYESLIFMIRMENLQQTGHLQINKNTLAQLNDLHAELLKSNIDPLYNAKFYHILPLINRLRQQQTNTDLSDVEICFNFQYAIMLLRMKKAEITPETTQAQTEIAAFLMMLSKNYSKYEKGELRLEEEI